MRFTFACAGLLAFLFSFCFFGIQGYAYGSENAIRTLQRIEATAPAAPAIDMVKIGNAFFPKFASVAFTKEARAAAAEEESDVSLIAKISAYIARFAAADSLTKVLLGILCILALVKTSFLRSVVGWDKMSQNAKVFVPLGMALVAGIIDLKVSTGHLVLRDVLAYVTGAGGGAILVHQLLDGVKALPGIGSVWVVLIEILGKALGQPAASMAKK